MVREKQNKVFAVSQLAEICKAELVGDGTAEIVAMAPIKSACASEIAFVSEEKYVQDIPASKAGAVLVNRKVDNAPMPLLVVKNVDAAVIETLAKFMPELTPPKPGIHPSAVVDSEASVDPTASIGPLVFIAAGVEIGAKTIISPGCKIDQNTKIGSRSRLESNVVVYHNCVIGNNCVIGANSTIGSMGFGYSYLNGQHKFIPHTGGVLIEDFVDIGAGCCIDRAKFGNTVIGAGTKTDNQVQIAHNVTIGKCSLIVAQVAVAGSSKIGNGVILAGQVGVRNHVEIGDGAKIGAQAGVINNIPAGSECVGTPAIDAKEKIRQVLATQKLPGMIKQLKQLTKKVEKLEAAKNNS
ncbi:MAG: UDP-3-O-(3-hydroxymyristoyl)glucosamine N-acyltransferase [Anaerohalosphaeraceae bacterium]|nr:UDP-3-O-(3-hydroxymyristoyl)glucosamine N-acyltransferase [Anaerohalosphaeraceae bacterium]